MTPREYYREMEELIDRCPAQMALLKVHKSDKIKDIKTNLTIIFEELKKEIEKEKPDDIYYGSSKEQLIEESREILNVKDNATFHQLRVIGLLLYTRFVSDTIRTYAYNLYKCGEVKDYQKLIDLMTNCMLDDMKKNELYDGDISKEIDDEIDY